MISLGEETGSEAFAEQLSSERGSRSSYLSPSLMFIIDLCEATLDPLQTHINNTALFPFQYSSLHVLLYGLTTLKCHIQATNSQNKSGDVDFMVGLSCKGE